MDFRRAARHASLIALPVIIVASLTPAFAQTQPGDGHKLRDKIKEHRDENADKTGEKNQWTEKYKDELREHPRLAHALVDLHVAKEHLEKAPHDFGGHRADAVKSCDEAIKQIELALKFDAKHDEKGNPPTTTPTTTTPPPKK